MADAAPAPNRLLNPAELNRSDFREILSRLDEMTARDDITYLHPGKRWEYPWALERAGLKPGEKVLDAGCGASIFPAYLADQGYRTTACDLDELPAGLQYLHGGGVDYGRADLTRMSYAADVFDAVFCISVIEHLPREAMDAAMNEFHRILRPGGRLLLTTDYYEDASAPLWYEGPGPAFDVDWNVFDRPRLEAVVLNADGFEVMGDIDLSADWELIRPRMLAFHGYPYTSVGVALAKSPLNR
ncbi:MAG: class I SAM-dependent methyltransferase [Thermodesulfobacteriota bacterium]